MTFGRIKELVKERYETGAYGGCHFHMSPELFEEFKTKWAMPHHRPTDAYQGLIQPLPSIMGIPILIVPPSSSVDPSIWSLVNRDESVVESGKVTLNGTAENPTESASGTQAE